MAREVQESKTVLVPISRAAELVDRDRRTVSRYIDRADLPTFEHPLDSRIRLVSLDDLRGAMAGLTGTPSQQEGR